VAAELGRLDNRANRCEKEKIVLNENNCNVTDKGLSSLASCNEAELRRARATVPISSSAVVSASTYDTLLHRDSRFLDVIAERRSSRRQSLDSGSFSRYGPTIGLRRNSATLKMYRRSTDSSSTIDENDKCHDSLFWTFDGLSFLLPIISTQRH
jgi:hypothetical protein